MIGAIDCTHVAIAGPPDDGFHNERDYVNIKGFHSINVQIVSHYLLFLFEFFSSLMILAH